MTEIHDMGPITPREKKMYEKEYKHGAVLFQKALEHSTKSNNPYQKEQFQDVMDKAMRVLNETARGLKREDLMKQNKQIEQDYKAYKDHPNDRGANKLSRDLDQAKKSIE